MKFEFTKFDWMRAKDDNVKLIIGNMMQIQMAKTVIEMCDKRIAEFPEDKKVEAKVEKVTEKK